MMAKAAGGSLRVGYRRENHALRGDTGWTHRRRPWLVGEPATFHLRCVMEDEIVFDVGDNTAWSTTRLETMCLWSALNDMGIPYWGALSGGSGTHTHVFAADLPDDGGGRPVAPQEEAAVDAEVREMEVEWFGAPVSELPELQRRCILDAREAVNKTPEPAGGNWRAAATSFILDVAGDKMSTFTGVYPYEVDFDVRLISPGADTRLVREFGRRKRAAASRRKVLWAQGPGYFHPLPKDLGEAYRQAEARGTIYPSAIPRSDRLRPMDRTWLQQFTDRPCPVGPQCIPGHRLHKPSLWGGTCEDCPLKDCV